ncbi:Pal1p KNAG_0C05150 [Huiozyma naganishii CBS 8797]|uniref:Pal1 cell morphology protein n=1 Tax=Huiozyma naganishii (strain ATCC MYA-139 / BCRC 22969 / CBS 8797 / KCTC 17520 / NBRC 10181 / NCYC 3082 / Yp74L-3) TaxID=1071383 RepID=J7S695_HUIN7|nr:hypothetical protein KNAG_0C05150 [Kazachstania naganishii CBS 8797]CCK69616.1 hypothetical protein KNAG_0C05150 [Kazachstania naganishii CBS 8797]
MQHTGGSGRQFASNNPFRSPDLTNTATGFGSLQDEQDGVWSARGSMQSQFSGDASPAVSSSAKSNSKNPFLDDISPLIPNSYSRPQPTYQQDERPGYVNDSPPQERHPRKYKNSEEEKEELRQRYLSDRGSDSEYAQRSPARKPPAALVDLPPSYDDVSESRTRVNKYPEEKRSSSHNSHSSRSRTHRHHSSHERNGSDHRTQRYHSGGTSNSGTSKKEKRKSSAVLSKNVDTIDKLDVTGLYGGSFHHDGPFDACTPQRNKNNKAAPVLAFPVDGPNSTIGGATTKKSAMNEVFGVEDIDDDHDLYTMKNTSKDAIRSNVGKQMRNMDTKNKTVQLHGTETDGLGSSTFLDGAPAVGIQRGNTISYRTPDAYDRRGSGRDPQDLRRNRSTNSRPVPHRFNSNEDYSSRAPAQDVDGDPDEDVYLGVRFDRNSKKQSTGNKFLNRVKSLKVGAKKI